MFLVFMEVNDVYAGWCEWAWSGRAAERLPKQSAKRKEEEELPEMEKEGVANSFSDA